MTFVKSVWLIMPALQFLAPNKSHVQSHDFPQSDHRCQSPALGIGQLSKIHVARVVATTSSHTQQLTYTF